jgi:hypothetical protein
MRVVCACIHGFIAAIHRVHDRQMRCEALGRLWALQGRLMYFDLFTVAPARGQGRWAARLAGLFGAGASERLTCLAN